MDSLDAGGWSVGEQEAALEIYDACAVAAWLHPELLVSEACHMEVDNEGRTLCDFAATAHPDGRGDGAPNCRVGTGIDRDQFVVVMHRALAGFGAGAHRP